MAKRLCDKRPKKFLGAIIGAATGLAGSIIGGIEQNNAAKRQARQQRYDAALQTASSLTQAYSKDGDYSKSFNDNYSLEFGNGGMIAIKKGGIAQPIGNGMSLLRGRKHTNGGIDIDVADKKIEAESGEVLQPTSGGLRIFSAKNMPGIGTPAKEVIENPNASDTIFTAQQLYKKQMGLSDSGKKKAFGDYLGIKRKFDSSSEEAFNKDVKSYNAKKETGQQIGDIASTAVNVASPIISGLFGLSAANKLKNPARPTLYRAGNLKTTYNINPQLSEIDKNENRNSAEIDNNTISSVASLARKQRLGIDSLGQRNSLLGQKENIETELQNNNIMNRQQVDANNTAMLNDYNNRVAETDNNRIALKTNAINGMLSGVAGAGRDLQARMDARKEKNDTLRAIVAGDSTNSTAVLMKKGAFDDQPEVLMKFMNSSDPAIAVEARRRMGYTGKSNPISSFKFSPIRPLTAYNSLTKPVWQK